jgi:flagellar basal-body rod modification protein FlgD
MAFNPQMTPQEAAKSTAEANFFNVENRAAQGRVGGQKLDKDDFLKLLLTQLSHQDPSSPMENTEFIAQMAQFSSLEQMSNMNQGFNRLASLFNSNEAVATLGKTVEIQVGENLVTGTVDAIRRGGTPEIIVNGAAYGMDAVRSVYNGVTATAGAAVAAD